MKRYICCLCGSEEYGNGNDPSPITTENENDECCDNCNLTKVVPARIELLISKTNTNVN
jgi:hypothetical protein